MGTNVKKKNKAGKKKATKARMIANPAPKDTLQNVAAEYKPKTFVMKEADAGIFFARMRNIADSLYAMQNDQNFTEAHRLAMTELRQRLQAAKQWVLDFETNRRVELVASDIPF